MRFWRGVLLASLGVLGLSAIAQAQEGSGVGALDARPGIRGESRLFHPEANRQPDTYGTSTVSYYSLDAFELLPYTSAATYAGINLGQLRYGSNVKGFVFQGAIHIPAGAMIVSMELDYYDGSASGQVVASLGICDHDGIACAFQEGICPGVATVCSGVADAPGYSFNVADLTGDSIQINNFLNRYIVFAGNTTTDGSTAISRIIIGYKLQVSPDPGYATFTDVPVGHPLHRFVEALVAAGITGGYPDGRFGVDDPITRGQLAVFLSVALGLNFP